MEYHNMFAILAVLLTAVTAKTSDTGPQTFIQNPPTTQLLPQRYGLKEVTMYLTASQILALQSGAASISQKTDDPNQFFFVKNAKGYQNVLTPEQNAEVEKNFHLAINEFKSIEPQQNQFQNPQNLQQTKPVVEPVDDISPPSTKLNNTTEAPQAYSYFHFNSDTQPQNFKVEINYPNQKQQTVYHQPKQQENNYEIITDPLLKQKFKLIPYEYSPNDETKAQLDQDLKSLQLPKELSDEALLVELRDKLQQNNLSKFKYAPQYAEHKYGEELEKIIESIRLEKEKAHAQILSIAKSPPVVVDKEISITKHRPVYITKHLNIRVPTPELSPYPEYFEVKAPQQKVHTTANLHTLQIINHDSYPVVKTEKVEVTGLSPVPFEMGKQIHGLAEKNYFNVNKPYIYGRVFDVRGNSPAANIPKKFYYQ